MRFRFGWKKEQKNQRHIDDALSDEKHLNDPEYPTTPDGNAPNTIVVNGRTEQEVTVTARIIFLGAEEEVGNLYSLFLRSKGYEVHHFPSSTCALLAQRLCMCPRDHLCADIIIAELDLDCMSGIDLFRHQNEKGCRALPRNKAIISSKFTNRQEYEAKTLGCKILCKPFRLLDIVGWIQECEKNIPADRKLTPLHLLRGAD